MRNAAITYAIELIDQKIREANAGLKAAKATLASLIQPQRGEQAMLGTLTSRIDDMTRRARQAIEAGRDDLANEAATTIASMENEQALRRTTIDRLDVKVIRLRASVESGSRSILELKQGCRHGPRGAQRTEDADPPAHHPPAATMR